MDPLDPVDWATLRSAGVRPEPTCEQFGTANRDIAERELAGVEGGGTIDGPGVTSRRPADETLHRGVVEETRVPWWLAVERGVHYSLVIYWCFEADVPLLWRNLPPESRAVVEATLDDESMDEGVPSGDDTGEEPQGDGHGNDSTGGGRDS